MTVRFETLMLDPGCRSVSTPCTTPHRSPRLLVVGFTFYVS